MQTKVLLILVILVLHTLLACTKPKTDNEQERSEITLDHDDSINDQKPPKAAYLLPADTLTPAVSTQPTAGKVVRAMKANQIKAVLPDSSIQHKEQKVEAIPEEKHEVAHAPEPQETPKSISHEIWNTLLQKYVSASGQVNYYGLKGEKEQLDIYIKLLSENYPNSKWDRNEQLAYWINVYNANTVKLILMNYPLKSITDLDKPWDQKFIAVGKISYSLNQIENEIIRPIFQEPRIHFAVNCAARSCPPLLNEAFTPEKLISQLEKQTRAFINSSANKITTNKVELSKIFDWYGEDFGELLSFIGKYSNVGVKGSAKISFLEYDWALNE